MIETKPQVRDESTPPQDVLRVQGKNRFFARVHAAQEKTTSSGLLIPVVAQNVPQTGTILGTSALMDKDEETGEPLYPDVKAGMCVLVGVNAWKTFKIDGVDYAVGDARSILAAYDPEDVCQE